MRKGLFEELTAIMPNTVYVFQEHPGGYVCDKLTKPDEGTEFERKRYLITGETQCTCLGWMKFRDCKHLKMLRRDMSWVKNPPPFSFAVEEFERLFVELQKRFTSFAERDLPDFLSVLEDAHPDTVRVMELCFPESEYPPNMVLAVSIAKWSEGYDMAIAWEKISADSEASE